MLTKNLGKIYPELEGLPPYEQEDILERARHEVQKDGKLFFLGTRFVLLGALIGGVSGGLIYFLSNGNDIIPPISGVAVAMAYIQIVIGRNIKILRPKVKELMQEKI